MRQLSKYAKQDQEVVDNLNIIIDKSIPPLQYSNAFYKLGKKLSNQINERIRETDKIVIACSTEDADSLAKGILDNLKASDNRLAVFWNLRTHPFGDSDITIAPIIKTYIEEIKSCDVLIICKSIIYTSCVVRTNLTYLIQTIAPRAILIAAPVIFKSAEKALSDEFGNAISSKFEFIYFAKDDKVTSGEVVPGIGGEIYKRLGIVDSIQKNKYIPELVKIRRG